MPEFNIAFAKISNTLPFIHILSVVVFIGFQANFLLIAKFFMKNIEGDTQKYQMMISMLKRLGYAVYSSIIVVGITGAILAKQNAIKNADPMLNTILTTEWAIWGFLFLNVIYVTYRLNKASKSLQNSEYIELHENLIVTIYYFIPLNVAFALLAAYLGIAYREF